MSAWLTIVGLGEGGVEGIALATLAVLRDAQVVLGPERLLALLTPSLALPARGRVTSSLLQDFATTTGSTLPLAGRAREGVASTDAEPEDFPPRLIPWTTPLDAMLAQVASLRNTPTVILATGDPLWFGIGATLAKLYPAEELTIVPHPSSFQLAAVRLRWPLQHLVNISLHGRAVETVQPHILPGNRILALTSDRTTAGAVADLLVDRGYGASALTTLENLGAATERIRTADAETFDDVELGDFYVLAIDCVAAHGAALLPPVPGLPDDAFVSDGQLTKREVRAATLAKLAPYPGALLWDIGAGCGSIAIEWTRAARDARAIAFEQDPARLQMIGENARALGTPTLITVPGAAPASLADQPTPDAVFIGGDVGNGALFEAAWAALKPGGRLVANAVTVHGEQAIYAQHEQFGGEIARIEVSVLDRIGDHRVMRPRMAVTQWLVIKP